jgi:glycine/D-amino acid oxidase-like deaminating enzyme
VKVGIVGGGITGLSTAWALARRGADVSLFEQGTLPNPLASSHDAHRLIREAYGAEIGYSQRVREAWGSWARLWDDLGVCHYVETGTLALATDAGGWTHDSRAAMTQLDWKHSILPRDAVAERFPWLVTEDVDWALWLDSGGVLLADRILEALSEHLSGSGVELLPNTPVLGVDASRGLVDTASESREFDAIVIAAGPWTAQLRPELSARITPSRQVVAFAKPPAEFAAAWTEAPMLLDVGSAGFYAVPPVAGTGLKIGDHGFSLAGDPSADRTASQAEVLAVFQSARGRFVNFEDYELLGEKVCFYTVERSERFVLDQREKMWGISGLSGHGFKFGPLLGEGIAAGVLGERSVEELAHWARGRGEGLSVSWG